MSDSEGGGKQCPVTIGSGNGGCPQPSIGNCSSFCGGGHVEISGKLLFFSGARQAFVLGSLGIGKDCVSCTPGYFSKLLVAK